MFGRADAVGFDHDPESHGATGGAETVPNSGAKAVDPAADRTADLARCSSTSSPICPITRSTADQPIRSNRYWRQALADDPALLLDRAVDSSRLLAMGWAPRTNIEAGLTTTYRW